MKKIKGELFLLTTALIWGFAVVLQTQVVDVIGTLTFNGVRYLIGAASLLPLLKFARSGVDNKRCIILGILMGLCISIGANLQMEAMAHYSSAAKVGFITSLYMVFVPILNFVMFRQKTTPFVNLSIIISVVGLYFLSGADLSFEISDILLIGCAFFFALQIVLIGAYAQNVNSVQLSFVQYISAGLSSLIFAFFFEDIRISGIISAGGTLLYTGVLSTGVAYTLQIFGQKDTDPTIASLILSMEAVISAISGFLFLNQVLSFQETFGCVLMFIAVMLTQIRFKGGKA